MSANLKNSAVATGLEKISFHSNPKEGWFQRMFKQPYNCAHFHASKVILKILQARLQLDVNWELPDVQAGFRKGKGTRDQTANIHWITEKAREFQKIIKPLTSWIMTNCDKLLKRWEYQTTLPISWETCFKTRSNGTRHGKMGWFKIRKRVQQAVFCHPADLTYVQST